MAFRQLNGVFGFCHVKGRAKAVKDCWNSFGQRVTKNEKRSFLAVGWSQDKKDEKEKKVYVSRNEKIQTEAFG